MPSIPPHLRVGPEYAAVSVIFLEFAFDARVWRHVHLQTHADRRKHAIDFDAILSDETFERTELVLLKVAASLWAGGDYAASLRSLSQRLDDPTFRVVLRAIAAFGLAPLRSQAALS